MEKKKEQIVSEMYATEKLGVRLTLSILIMLSFIILLLLPILLGIGTVSNYLLKCNAFKTAFK